MLSGVNTEFNTICNLNNIMAKFHQYGKIESQEPITTNDNSSMERDQ